MSPSVRPDKLAREHQRTKNIKSMPLVALLSIQEGNKVPMRSTLNAPSFVFSLFFLLWIMVLRKYKEIAKFCVLLLKVMALFHYPSHLLKFPDIIWMIIYF